MALHEAGILGSKYLKPSVKRIILQSSETPNWHHTAHYRSPGAGEKIEEAIKKGVVYSISTYQRFCCQKKNEIRHEHMVPTEFVYGLIVDHKEPSFEVFKRILDGCGFRASILVAEDKRLHSYTVPDPAAWKARAQLGHFDHLCRYQRPKHGEEPISLDRRPSDGWIFTADLIRSR